MQHHRGGLSHSLPPSTASIDHQVGSVPIVPGSSGSNRAGDSPTPDQAGHKGSGPTLPGASISPVCHTEEEWSAQSNSQSSQSKLSHSSTSFQDGVSASSLSHHSLHGLDDFHRPNRCLSACFGQQGFSTVSSVRLRRPPVSIPRASFWSVLIPACLYQDPTPGPSLGSATVVTTLAHK